MSLRRRLVELIGREGPLPVSRYMALCLHDPDQGYYATRPNLGAAGDFVTAPLVSQIFGEALGAWAARVWLDLGRPRRFRLVELGPGEGVMIGDVLRAAAVCPGFLAASELWLVETSGPLRRRQAARLDGIAVPRWVAGFAEVPADAPMIVLANEFLDCLPIDQAVLGPDGWRERRVGLGAAGELVFEVGGPARPPSAAVGARLGDVVEWSTALESFGALVGERVAECGGAALFIDYGRCAPGYGDTLQALRGHCKEHPLAHPGEADLTAHVDFPAFLAAARAGGACTPPIVGQSALLGALGVEERAEVLSRSAPAKAAVIGRQLARLMAPDQMGVLFKAAVVHARQLETVPGFGFGP